MSIGERVLLTVNRFLPVPEHPFNLNNEQKLSYVEWQFQNGERTLEYYTDYCSLREIFDGKIALDVGCGAGGKSVYYATLGAIKVVGLDVLPKYRKLSEDFAASKGLGDKFRFICADAAKTGFPDNLFDVIIMNDAMEHVGDPAAVLKELERILAPGGKLYINFAPWGHPWGAHLQDLIGIPYAQCFFREKTLISAYKKLCENVPDGDERVEFRVGKNEKGKEYFSYVNKMSLRWFKKILKKTGLRVDYYREAAFPQMHGVTKPLQKVPVLKEHFTRMVVCVLVKDK